MADQHGYVCRGTTILRIDRHMSDITCGTRGDRPTDDKRRDGNQWRTIRDATCELEPC